jgi:hypothetical protein
MAVHKNAVAMWVGAVLPLIMPALAVRWYPELSYFPTDDLMLRYAVAPCVYAASVAAAVSAFERRLYLRLLYCIPAMAAGTLLGITFDVIMILAVALLAGLVAVGVAPASIIYHLVYRLVRMVFAGALVFGALRLPLPTTGACPGGGGEITGHFGTFLTITYILVFGLIALDGVVWRVRETRANRRAPSIDQPVV